MDLEHPTQAPPNHHGAFGPWVEISAWILAVAILLAAQCVPERSAPEAAPSQPSEMRAP